MIVNRLEDLNKIDFRTESFQDELENKEPE